MAQSEDFAGAIVVGAAFGAFAGTVGRGASLIRLVAFASGWMRIRQRAKQGKVWSCRW
jgi:hypothetical protein